MKDVDFFTPGAKLDAGKEPMRLILHAMPRALLEVGKVGAYGAAKYSPNGWLSVPDAVARYTDAMFRHALREGIEPHDEESGLLHAAQVAWNALARLELMLQQSSNVTVTPVKLPSDVARCVGVGDQLCNTCARLSISGSEKVWVWPEPLINDGKCELFIDGCARPTRSTNVEF